MTSTILVKCPFCKRDQYLYLDDFKRTKNKFRIKEVCNNCGKDFTGEFEIKVIKRR